VFKWGVLLLLLLLLFTLGWKLAVRPGDSWELKEKETQLKVAEFLVRQRFIVAVSEIVHEGEPMIRATAGACRMLVVKSPALGWDRDLIRRQATAGDQIFVVFAGRIYAEQPTWLTVPDFLWARLRRELGANAQPTPVLAVIATTSCAAERLPWNELRVIGWMDARASV
jgi:hypothetical protein